MGAVTRERKRDRLQFTYDQGWQGSPNGFPLSNSMPLSARGHDDGRVRPFLAGLLPDNNRVLEQWGKRFKVSPRNAFALLQHVGEECAGAVQFVRPDRVSIWKSDPAHGEVDWLSRKELDARIRLLIQDHSAARSDADEGHFSLAGAQSKTALYRAPKGRRWGVPSGSIPTTHILKPATGEYDGLVINEHICLQLARECRLPSAVSTIEMIAGVPVIVVERFDRYREDDQVRRVHQEDMCQALGVRPEDKYQSQDGPTPVQIVRLIRDASTDALADVNRFVDALIFNWLIAGTDAHAKNYSLLIAPNGHVRLSPFYDLSSSVPYPRQIDPHKAKLAMKIGGKYKLAAIGRREWIKCAEDLHIDPDDIFGRIEACADRVLSALDPVVQGTMKNGIDHPIVRRLRIGLKKRIIECIGKIGTVTS